MTGRTGNQTPEYIGSFFSLFLFKRLLPNKKAMRVVRMAFFA
jgi:hypothetical protein